MFDIDFLYYASNLQFSFLIMNLAAGFYFTFTRFVNWPSISEATTMERQGKFMLLFVACISAVNALEVGLEDSHMAGWFAVMLIELVIGAAIGIVIDRYYRL